MHYELRRNSEKNLQIIRRREPPSLVWPKNKGSIPQREKAVIRLWLTLAGYYSGKMPRNYSEQEEHKIKPHVLRNLRKHAAVVVHCEDGYRRKLLPPLESDGKVARWFTY
jgi:hypothetical protein